MSDVEDIDDTSDCPVTSRVQYEDGVALLGRSSPRLVVSQPVRAEVPVRADVPVASGSGQSLCGNKCLDEEDVQLLATATSDYRSTLVTTYASITVERVFGLLRAQGGPYPVLAKRFQVRVNGLSMI